MKVSELWLREWVNPPLDAKELAGLLTMAGLEVDAVSPVAGAFEQVIVAEVMSTVPHSQANKLTVCQVNTGASTPVQIVCGASNVRPGLKVALAQIGANLPGGIQIKETTLRGELSQGMLCSVSELGLAESSDGIMELDDDAPVGVNLRIYLSLDDNILDIDLTPNRADCFSMQGVAREVAALTQQSLTRLPLTVVQPSIDETRSVELKATEACPRYAGRIIKGLNSQAQTPLWMSERLNRAGIRPLSPVVDVTNYVMLEMGQPMHAFDLERLEGDICVRFAKPNEVLTLLDGQDVELEENVLVIADSQKPLSIAGIMGGEDSSIQEETTAVFLECAYFNPVTIAGVARRYGLCSDSSQRFERGVDPAIQEQALERATSLLLEIAGGSAGPVVLAEEARYLPVREAIAFNPEQVRQITGIPIPEAEMKRILEGLEMKVTATATSWQVTAPGHRFDIRLEVDLVEEIIRLYGYDKMHGQKMIAAVQPGTINPYESLVIKASELFKARGYQETISYSFVDPELQQALYPDNETMKILNPISSELSEMRVGMWPGLLASMVYNVHRQQTAVQFFETGVVFDLSDGELREQPSIAGLLTGQPGTLNWSEQRRKFDYFDLKGDLEALFSLLKLTDRYQFIATQHPALHPGKSAAIMIDGELAGYCGALHPRLADALDITDEVLLFELQLGKLINSKSPRYEQISKFPQIRRDLSLLVDSGLASAEIEKLVREVVSADLLKSFDVFDLYTGEGIPEGKKSLAIALTLQDGKRTMVDSEINTIISAIINKLDEQFSIILRD